MATDNPLKRDPTKVIKKISVGANYGSSAENFVGGKDDLWFDDNENYSILRRGDGVTPGGHIVGGSGSGQQGATGPQGPQGPQGDTGPQGPQGPQGDTGPQGPQGDTGPQGATGPQGPAGSGSGSTGPQGPQGDTGPQGPQGDTGPQGPAGADGADGADGAVGAQGPQGPQGPAGADGADGADGTGGCLLKIDVIQTVRDNTMHTINLSAQTDYIEIYPANDDTSGGQLYTNEWNFGFATNALNGYFSSQRQNGYVDATVISTSGNSTFYMQDSSGINDGAAGNQLVIKQYSSNLSSNATLPALTIMQDQVSSDQSNPTQFDANSYSSIFIVGTANTSRYWELLDGSFSGQTVHIYHLKESGSSITGRINKLGVVDNNGTYATVQSSFSFSGTFIWNGTHWFHYPTLN